MAVVKEFIARPGSHLTDEDAATVGSFLEERFGEAPFPTEEVVEAARPARSPIHRYFQWNDAEAAREFRLVQARRLVGAVMTIERVGDEEVRTRAYHHVVVGARTAYVSEKIVWESPLLADQVIEKAQREFNNWRERYRQYGELLQWAAEQLADES